MCNNEYLIFKCQHSGECEHECKSCSQKMLAPDLAIQEMGDAWKIVLYMQLSKRNPNSLSKEERKLVKEVQRDFKDLKHFSEWDEGFWNGALQAYSMLLGQGPMQMNDGAN